MTKSMLVRSTVLTTAIVALAGCGSISSTLGLERHVPDESQVVVRPALTLPPDFDLMPPGTPSAVSGEHETASANSTASPGQAPKKEERGFFGSLFHGDFFGNDVDATTAKPAADATTPPAAAETPAAPPADGTPQAPAPATK